MLASYSYLSYFGLYFVSAHDQNDGFNIETYDSPNIKHNIFGLSKDY